MASGQNSCLVTEKKPSTRPSRQNCLLQSKRERGATLKLRSETLTGRYSSCRLSFLPDNKVLCITQLNQTTSLYSTLTRGLFWMTHSTGRLRISSSNKCGRMQLVSTTQGTPSILRSEYWISYIIKIQTIKKLSRSILATEVRLLNLAINSLNSYSVNSAFFLSLI